jgi:GT2 family glycosyltransferase
MTSPRVSVVVPNWNGLDLLDRCLDSVRAQTERDLEIIVVDNGSTDGSPEHVRRHHPDVRLVALTVNQGFAGGVNAGVHAARGEFVALLNNDAWAAPDWLERLTARLAAEPAAGACAPKIYRADGREPTRRLDSTGELYSIWGLPFPRGRDEIDRGQYDDATAVFAVSGAASVYRAALFAAVGDFDPDFFAYFEDVDLSFRGQLAGFSMLYEPSAVVFHRVGASSGGGMTPFSRHHFVKNSWFLFLKDMPAPLLWRHLARFLVLQLGLLWGSARLGLLGAHTRALLRVIARGPAMVSRRRRIQRAAVRSHQEIDRMLVRELPPGIRRGRRLVKPLGADGAGSRTDRASRRRGTGRRSRRRVRSTAGGAPGGSPPSS